VSFSHAGLTDCRSCHASRHRQITIMANAQAATPPAAGKEHLLPIKENRIVLHAMLTRHLQITILSMLRIVTKPEAAGHNFNFNHSGYTDCSACHTNTAPVNHYTRSMFAMPHYERLGWGFFQSFRTDWLCSMSCTKCSFESLCRAVFELP